MTNNRFNPITYLFVLLACSALVAAHARSSQLGSSKEDCKCENLKETEYRIVNGTKSAALEEGLPWIGFLFTKKNERGIPVNKIVCTLTIVGRYWALTASHCVKNKKDKTSPFIPNLHMGAGLDHNSTKILKEPKNLRKVKEIYIPKREPVINATGNLTSLDLLNFLKSPNANFNMHKNDIALLKVSEPWEFSEVTRILPACLMNFERDHFEDTFLAAGYGRNETWYKKQGPFNNGSQGSLNNGSHSGVGELTMTRLKLTNLTRYYFGVNSSFSSLCHGDSGSPLHYFVSPILYVVGVASTVEILKDSNDNRFFCVPGQTNTFVSVYNHLSWIRNITRGDLCEIDGATRDQTEESTPGSTTANSNHTTSGSSRPLLLLAGCSLAISVLLSALFLLPLDWQIIIF